MRKIISVLCLFASLSFSSCTQDVYTLTGSINGIITDASTGEPVANVTVTLSPSGKSATTGSDGNYEFVDLEAIQYKIQVRHADYKTDTKTVSVLAGDVVRGDFQLMRKD